MRSIIAAGAVIAATISGAAAQACAAGTASEINGNWYCSAVNAITYTNFGQSSGSYNEVTSMDGGNCQSKPHSYSGAMSPLDEEVSWHFRGPLTLKQFAVYTPGSGSRSSKREVKPSLHSRRHGHQHFHARNKEIREIQEIHQVEERVAQEEKRGAGDMVTATINGQVVSWANQYAGGAAASPAAAAGDGQMRSVVPAAASGASSPKAATPSMNAGSGNWGRQAYYNADSQTADGLVFLNHNGGQGSGVFDMTLGSSLSYASSDGQSGASSPQTLANKMIPDNVEIVVMSDSECANGDCGTTRGVAYHGWNGASKAFLLEFSMPATGKTGWNEDMPAAWILNAQIPRTLQYGKADCSCWTSGCGEWDIFEILDSGNTRAKSTLHGNVSGGDSNYFQRPTGGTIKAAVVFEGDSMAGHIQILPDDTVFGTTMSANTIAGFCNNASNDAAFALTS